MDFHAELGVANLDMPTQLNAPTGSSRETQTPGASTAPSYPRGYPELAAFMQSDAGFGILRRFNYLHLRKLLYMQEELTLLETQLHAVDNSELDDLNNMTRREDNNEERKMLMAEIQTKLLEYDDLLIRYRCIFNFNPPSKRNLRNFRRWFDAMTPLVSEESTVFQDTGDLCALSSHVSDFAFLEKIFSPLVAVALRNKTLKKIFQTDTDDKPRNPFDQVLYASDHRIHRAMRLTNVISASLSLLVPIIVLYFVHTSAARLICIVLFTLFFAAALGAFTNAKSSEIFAGTAAFSAVMVVFVGTGLGSD